MATYDKGGLLKTVTLNSDVYVQDIHYNAKSQRSAIWHGNGTKTGYTYDVLTFRLRRLLTVNVNALSPHYNEVLQDLHYWYDPVGNITQIHDYAQQTLFYNNSVVSPEQDFTYDALYRLIEAKGRELIGTALFGSEDNWDDAPWQTAHKGDGNAVQRYIQQYTYDEVGNILELDHAATAGSYTRTYNIATNSNRLLSTTVGVSTYTYTHDVRGNMLTMPHLTNMAWNLNNELKSIEKGTDITSYQYSGGTRVRKFTDKGTVKEERIYLGNYEIYRKFDSLSSLIHSTGSVQVLERTTVHVSDDTGRIAMLEIRTEGSDPSPAALTRYVYSNHLQSAALELNEDAEIISYEEYHPYGTTSYQANNASINAVAKRYRYTGKERDEETGLYYHGARYYIPWLARWSASDPMESKYAGLSPYNYCANNPIIFLDDDGRDIIHFIKTVTVTNVPKSGLDNFPSKPIVQSSFRIEITPSKGADVFKYSDVNITQDENKRTTRTTTSILHPENSNSAVGMTKGKNLYFDGLITTERNNKDWESVGKIMAADKNFSNYMQARNPEAKKWESMAFGYDAMERVMPDLVRGGFASYLGMRFLGGAKSGSSTINSSKDIVYSDKNSQRVWAYVDKEAVAFYEQGFDGSVKMEINLSQTLKNQGIGSKIFKEAVEGVDMFKAEWVESNIYTSGISDNLLQFRGNIAKGMSNEQAAWNTWSGRQAANNGFKTVEVTKTENGINAIFKR